MKFEETNMRLTKVPGGNNKHKVLMYAISTCGWCKRAKRILNDMDVEYEYIDIDLCSNEDKEKIREDITRRGGRLLYPTIIINNEILLTNPTEKDVREALRL
jgi:glutaredoxin-like protein NrdH